jgi:OOP family OmpA-OmpF porin
MRILKNVLPVIAIGGLLAGCAGAPYSPASFTPTGIDTSAYVAKVDAFVVVMDASSSMNFDHEDRKNFYTAKDVVTHLNQTVPELGYKAALVGFGSGSCVNREDARVVYGPDTYQRAGFSDGLMLLECAGGITPMSEGIGTGGHAVMDSTGQVALILVSDFWEVNSSKINTAVDGLKAEYGARLCIHTIHVGGHEKSSDLIAGLAGVNACGSSTDAAALASSSAMAAYVTDVLLEPAADAVIKYEKNTISASALFDHDKSALKEEGKAAMHDLDESIKARGADVVDINVIGHTDSDGAEEYNMALSIRRAEAIRDYMDSEGVDASIIDISGEGESNPIASNATKEGRAENRRVDIHVGVKQPVN